MQRIQALQAERDQLQKVPFHMLDDYERRR